jgi:hypothetical protein
MSIPPQGDLLEEDLEDPDAERLGREQRRIEQRGLAFTPPADEPVHQGCHRGCSDREQSPDELAAGLPDQDADHEPAHAHNGEDGAHHVHGARPRVGHVANQPAPRQDDRNDDRLEEKPYAPRHERREKAPHQRADCGGNRP